MFYQIFFSPQVKRCIIITYKHGIYLLPHDLPNDLRLRKLGNIKKVCFVNNIKKHYFTLKLVSLKYFVNNCS